MAQLVACVSRGRYDLEPVVLLLTREPVHDENAQAQKDVCFHDDGRDDACVLGDHDAPRDADGAEPVLAGRVPADVRRKSRGGGFVSIETHVQRRPSEDDLRPGPVAPTRGRQRKALTQKVAERVRIFGPRSPSRVMRLARQFTPMAVRGGELATSMPGCGEAVSCLRRLRRHVCGSRRQSTSGWLVLRLLDAYFFKTSNGRVTIRLPVSVSRAL